MKIIRAASFQAFVVLLMYFSALPSTSSVPTTVRRMKRDLPEEQCGVRHFLINQNFSRKFVYHTDSFKYDYNTNTSYICMELKSTSPYQLENDTICNYTRRNTVLQHAKVLGVPLRVHSHAKNCVLPDANDRHTLGQEHSNGFFPYPLTSLVNVWVRNDDDKVEQRLMKVTVGYSCYKQ